MKKNILILLGLCVLSYGVLAEGISVQLDFAYAYGISNFFTVIDTPVNQNNIALTQSVANNMGFGFSAGVAIPFMENVRIIPSFALNFGSQKTTYSDNNPIAPVVSIGKSYYFQVYSPAVDIAYDAVKLANGWTIYALGGVNLNMISADTQPVFSSKNVFGLRAGVGFKFLGTSHFGMQSLFYFKTLLGGENLSYVGIDAGISYHL